VISEVSIYIQHHSNIWCLRLFFMALLLKATFIWSKIQ